MMRKVLLAALAAALVPVAHAAPPSAEDRAALEALATQLDRVWDAGDPAGVAALYATEGTLRLNNRPFEKGQAAVRRYFEVTLARRPAGARHFTRILDVDMLTPDLAMVDTHASVERELASGDRQVLADFHNQTIAVREQGTWRFRVVRAQRMTNEEGGR